MLAHQVLYSAGEGQAWVEVAGFPANIDCPEGVAPEEWDDDGDRWGRGERSKQSPPQCDDR